MMKSLHLNLKFKKKKTNINVLSDGGYDILRVSLPICFISRRNGFILRLHDESHQLKHAVTENEKHIPSVIAFAFDT